MSDAVRLLRLGTVPYLRSQSIYHCIAECMTPDTPDTIVLLTPREPYICVGYHQDIATRIDLERCRARGIPIVRRRLGGGAVYLDSDQLFYQCIFNRNRAPAQVNALFQKFLEGPVAALSRLGLDASLVPPNEIEVGGRRIAGTGAGQIREAAVVVGNILIDFDYATMTSLWNTPSESFRRLARGGLREHVTTLKRELGGPIDPALVEQTLIDTYSETLQRPLVPGELNETELAALDKVGGKLVSDSWVHREGSLRGEGLKISARSSIREKSVTVDATVHTVTARITDGAIADVDMDPPIPGLQHALRGWRPGSNDPGDTWDRHAIATPGDELLALLRGWTEEEVN